jgi:putative ABC transport system permease protein
VRGVRRAFSLALFRRRDVVRDVDDEIASHLAMREAKLVAQGHAPSEASRIARERFGDVDTIRAECLREEEAIARRGRMTRLMEEAGRDAQLAVRSLTRAKGFTIAVILTLALGIGANATIYSVMSSVVLRPINGIDRIDDLFELGDVVSYPLLRDLQTRVPALRLAAISERRIALGRGAGVDQATGGIVSGGYFPLLEIKPSAGRLLTDADDQAGSPVVGVLSHEYWTSALGNDPSVVGKTFNVNGSPVTVVGVAPRGFHGLHLGSTPAIWLPIHAWPAIAPSTRSGNIETRNWDWLSVIGRNAPGTDLAQTQTVVATALSTIEQKLEREQIESLAKPRAAQAAALDSRARGAVVRFMAILAAVVVLVLLTACANIAGLLLSRAAHREREIAVRVALGAGRGRLVRQLLTEAIVLAAAGGLAGTATFLGIRAALARATLPGGIAGSSLGMSVDGRLIAFAAAITLITGVLVGIAPAIHASRHDPSP